MLGESRPLPRQKTGETRLGFYIPRAFFSLVPSSLCKGSLSLLCPPTAPILSYAGYHLILKTSVTRHSKNKKENVNPRGSDSLTVWLIIPCLCVLL